MNTADTNTAAVLIAARAIISDPAMWYQGDWTEAGGWDNNDACCAECAIMRASKSLGIIVPDWRFEMRKHTPTNQHIHVFNDCKTTTHADILAMFDRAIAAAKVPA